MRDPDTSAVSPMDLLEEYRAFHANVINAP
jgi:hypothetical protein